jgi:hypothetical protein
MGRSQGRMTLYNNSRALVHLQYEKTKKNRLIVVNDDAIRA